ncbi:MAG: GNAT family N-acetyltransferase [Cellulosilyticum sp.]|nr:GNAT family N-acetyltransferase [Cellulosilyticum sp.]
MITIRRALYEDAEHITEIKTRAYNKEINMYLGRDGGPRGYNEVASEKDIINRFIAYKIMLEEKIIGAFFLIPQGEEKMRFEDFVIEPEYQNKGYGYETLRQVEAAYPNIREWRLSTPVFSIGNQHLYEKFGYKIDTNYKDEEEIEYIKAIDN